MQKVLIDTSVLLDLVLYFQVRHRRNRSVASSAAAAIECLTLYDHPTLEELSGAGVLNSSSNNRFLSFYCDQSGSTAVKQFESMVELCEILSVPTEDMHALYESAVATMAKILSPIADPDDLRAYELYDYLPYHLGEDPTALECQVVDHSVVDLDDIRLEDADQSHYLSLAASVLRSKQHPVRAAWALPLLRLFYYQSLQMRFGLHYVPHATKSTIAFGRESETVSHRRLLEYCSEEFKTEYLVSANMKLSALAIIIPIPRFAEAVLLGEDDWNTVSSEISRLREEPLAIEFRRVLARLFSEIEEARWFEDSRIYIEDAYREVEDASRNWSETCQLPQGHRRIRLALPVSEKLQEKSRPTPFMLTHDLFAATGIAEASLYL